MVNVLKTTSYSDGSPRVYRASGGWLAVMLISGLLLFAGGIAGTWFYATGPTTHLSSRYLPVGVFGPLTVLGFYCFLSALRSRVILFDDRIEVAGLIRSRVMARSDISGWRSISSSPPLLVLVPLQPETRNVAFAQTFRPDAEFADWLLGLPCLDRDDAQTSKSEIRNNPNLGTTPGERMRTLERGRRVARILGIITCALCCWGIAYPRPYEWLTFSLAVLPWIALAIVGRSHGLFRVDGYRNDAHPNVAITVIAPALILFLRSTDFEIIYSSAIAWLSAAVGILLCLGAVKVDPSMRTRRGSLIALFCLFLIYGYGVIIEANVLFDQTTGVTYTAPVMERRIVRGKTTVYELRVGPWGPRAKPNDIRVSSATYEYIRPGNVVKIVLKRGALGVKWYYLLSWDIGKVGSNHEPATRLGTEN